MKRKNVVLLALFLMTALGAYAQKQLTTTELVAQIQEGKNLAYENVIFTDDIDLSNFGANSQTGQYPENGKIGYVFTNFVKQPAAFKNCVFKGKLILFTKTETASDKKEYRVEFMGDVRFENCVFEKFVDFELTNFNKAVSFEGTVFKEQPRFVRMGIEQKPNIQGLKLEKNCLFQVDQSKKQRVLTAKELEKRLDSKRLF